MLQYKAVIILLLAALSLLGVPFAKPLVYDGHGPVFGLATPTNGKGGWSFNLGVMSRHGADDTGIMTRGMLAYGITADLMISVSMPVVLSSVSLAPARMTSMMPGTGDFEGILSWRIHREGIDVGRRFESTVYGGIILPGIQKNIGLSDQLKRAPGIWMAAATGFASRSHYFWMGVGYEHFAQSHGDKRANLLFYSITWGYRPPAFREDYPHWDWRLFLELSGENSGNVRLGGIDIQDTGRHQIFIGPTTLGIYKNIAMEGGIQFPVYQSGKSKHPKENLRLAINFSYFF